MLNIQSEYIGAVRRCIGDAVDPAATEIEFVAAKIWHEATPGRVSVAGWPAACGDQDYYRRAARVALEGRHPLVAL